MIAFQSKEAKSQHVTLELVKHLHLYLSREGQRITKPYINTVYMVFKHDCVNVMLEGFELFK